MAASHLPIHPSESIINPNSAPEDSIDTDTSTQELLLASSQHDIPLLKTLLRDIPATVQDPETLTTPLHSAIAACEATEDEDVDIEKAKEAVSLLFQHGAIWNDLDASDETPGCIAWRIGRRELYEMMVEAGVRAELLLARLDEWQRMEEDEDDSEIIDITGANDEAAEEEAAAAAPNGDAPHPSDNPDLLRGENALFLSQPLTFTTTSQSASLVTTTDASATIPRNSAVMMPWELPLMSAHATSLLPRRGQRVLNIGHGLGLFDAVVQLRHRPDKHHIVEAHPDVLAHMHASKQGPDAVREFLPRDSLPDEKKEEEGEGHWLSHKSITIHPQRWQDALPSLVASGETFDAIYYDTYAEGYDEFKRGFVPLVETLLAPGGRWAFFNGGGADRRVSYDVQCRVVEADLESKGWEVEWEDVPVEKEGGRGDEKGVWEGGGRPYWVLERYRLPIVRRAEDK